MQISKIGLTALACLAATIGAPRAVSAADSFSAVYVMSDNLGDKGFERFRRRRISPRREGRRAHQDAAGLAE